LRWTKLQPGWIWHVAEGGWFELEATRPLFMSEKYKAVMEYLIVGDNECVKSFRMIAHAQ
jgi:hypothetical protein